MSPALMSQSQQSAASDAWKWSLVEGRALRLPADSRPRWLLVTEGRLWLTHSAESPTQVPLDCWLEAGDSLELPADQDAVVESWPSARFELLEAAPRTAVSASVALKPSAALRRWLQGASLAPAPCAS